MPEWEEDKDLKIAKLESELDLYHNIYIKDIDVWKLITDLSKNFDVPAKDIHCVLHWAAARAKEEAEKTGALIWVNNKCEINGWVFHIDREAFNRAFPYLLRIKSPKALGLTSEKRSASITDAYNFATNVARELGLIRKEV